MPPATHLGTSQNSHATRQHESARQIRPLHHISQRPSSCHPPSQPLLSSWSRLCLSVRRRGRSKLVEKLGGGIVSHGRRWSEKCGRCAIPYVKRSGSWGGGEVW